MIVPNKNEMVMMELWEKIPEYVVPDAKPHYLISTWGRIYNIETDTILPQNINYNKDKYITIRLSPKEGTGKTAIFVQPHRVLLMTYFYIEGCENLDVNHLDGIKYHNWLWNLEWATRKENIQHALSNGLFNLGSTRGNSKLNESQVRRICELISDGKGPKEIEKLMNIPNCNIEKIVQNIKNGYSWKHISCEYDFGQLNITNESL